MVMTMMQTINDAPVNDTINPNCLLLYTCSTISYIKNYNLIKYIRACDTGKELWAYTHGGHQDYNYNAIMTILPFGIFYNINSLTNILTFAAVARRFMITIEKDI